MVTNSNYSFKAEKKSYYDEKSFVTFVFRSTLPIWPGPRSPLNTVEQNKTVKCTQCQDSKYRAELCWPSTALPCCVDRLPTASGPAGHRKQEETRASQLTASHLTGCLGSAPHYTNALHHRLGCGLIQSSDFATFSLVPIFFLDIFKRFF